MSDRCSSLGSLDHKFQGTKAVPVRPQNNIEQSELTWSKKNWIFELLQMGLRDSGSASWQPHWNFAMHPILVIKTQLIQWFSPWLGFNGAHLTGERLGGRVCYIWISSPPNIRSKKFNGQKHLSLKFNGQHVGPNICAKLGQLQLGGGGGSLVRY